MPTIRLPLFGSIESRDYKSFFDGVTADGAIKYDQGGTDVQFDVLTDNVNGKKIGYFYPRENFATSGVPASTGAGTAIKCWTGSSNAIVTAFGATNSTVYIAAVTQGAITGQAAFITEGLVGEEKVANIFVVNTAGTKAYYGTGAGSLTEITDAQYPANQTPALVTTGPMVQYDDYCFIMTTDGKIWNSDRLTVASYLTTSDYAPANKKPDKGIGLARYGAGLVGFGATSTEFFFDAGNATFSPLSGDSTFINQGCANQYAYCNIADTVAFFSTNAGIGIFVLEGQQAKKISTPPIDRILAGMTAANVRLNPFVSHGKLFLLVTSPVSPGQLAYDIAAGSWQFWNMTGNQVTQSDVVPGGSSVYVGPTITSYFATSATGKSGTFLTGKFDAGVNNRKFINAISIVSAMGSTAATTIDLSWSDDDYETFSTPITLSVNAGERPQRVRSGAFITRAFKVTGSNDSSGRILRNAALEIDYDVGSW